MTPDTSSSDSPSSGNNRHQKGRSPIAHLLPIILLAVVAIGWYATNSALETLRSLPDATLPCLRDRQGIEIYDRANNYVATIYAGKDRKPVALTRMSHWLIKAVISAEDHSFFQHHGVNPVAIGRAALIDLQAGRFVEGGSTITQQLVRNLFLDMTDRSLHRKAVEAILACKVESRYSKAKILETYLNEVYFGNGVFGVERAAEQYFNKPAAQLSLPESAFLAGLIKAPSDLSRPSNRKTALTRQHLVLANMVAMGYITQRQADHSAGTKLRFNRMDKGGIPFPYYMSYVLQTLEKDLGPQQIWGKGLRVYTNLDQQAQRAAERVLNREIAVAPPGINQGALVCESLRDGAVLAMVGGVGNYKNHQWNRAIYPHTAGSSFKPFTYLAALIAGAITLDSYISDSPVAFPDRPGKPYCPRNFDNRFYGPLTARQALALSRNVCAVKLAFATGPAKIVQAAHAAGITSHLDSNLSIALGSCAVSPLEMATAYATLGRNGNYVAPRMVRHVDDAQGNRLRLYSYAPIHTLPRAQVAQLVEGLREVVAHGTGTHAQLGNIPVAGKTGTADKSRDLWFVGFTPDAVAAVWGGNDKNLVVRGNVTGGTVMAHIWHDYMKSYYDGHPELKRNFTPPKRPQSGQPAEGIVSVPIDETY
jgi:1A family penicillin-binding protein